MKKWICSFVWVLSAVSGLMAQDFNLFFRKLKPVRENGMEFIHDILKDSKGRIWIAAHIGLFLYDGANYIEYRGADMQQKPAPIAAQSICEDKEGNIWGATETGIVRLVPETGACKRFLLPAKLNINYTTDVVCDREGNIWGVSAHNVLMYHKNGDSIQSIVEVNPTRDSIKLTRIKKRGLLYDKQQHCLYLATTTGLVKYDIAQRKITNKNNHGNNQLFKDANTGALARASDSSFLFFDNDKKDIVFFNPTKEQVTKRIPIGKTLPNALGGALFVSADGKIWFSSWTDEVIVVHPGQQDSIQNLTKGLPGYHQFPSRFFWKAMQDEDGTIWFAAPGGIVVSNPYRNPFRFYAISDRIPQMEDNETITCIFEDPLDASWWLTTTGYRIIHYFPESGELEVSKFSDAIPSQNGTRPIVHYFISLFKENLAFSFKEGVWIWYRATKKLYPIGKTAGNKFPFEPHQLVPIANDTYLLNNLNRMVAWNTKNDSFFEFANQAGLGTPLFLFDFRYKGRQTAQPYCLHKNGWLSQVKDHSLITANLLPDKRQAESGFVTDYDVDSAGNLWLAYHNIGLIQLQPAKNKIVCFETTDDLPFLAEAIAVDKEQNVWCISKRYIGIFLAQKQQYYRMTLPEFTQTNVWYNKMTALTKGTLLANIANNLVEFFPDRLLQVPHKKNPQISELWVGNRKINSLQEQSIELASEENDVKIKFGLLTDKNLFPYTLYYQLKGADEQWRPAGEVSEAFYNKLPPGRYVFKVKAMAANGNWESDVRSLEINIHSPFYKTWWFMILCAMLFCMLTYAFYHYRIKQHRQMFELRTKASMLEREKATIQYDSLKQQLNPHFLFNSLTSLYGLIHVDQDVAADFLDKMSAIYRYILKNGDKETISLQEELQFVQLYIDLQQTRFGKGLVVNMHVPDEYIHFKIAPVTLQNMIENALKHNIIDRDSPLIIDLFVEGDYLCIRNNLQKKTMVETSNKQGLTQLKKLYQFLTDKPIHVVETETSFMIRIPFI